MNLHLPLEQNNVIALLSSFLILNKFYTLF